MFNFMLAVLATVSLLFHCMLSLRHPAWYVYFQYYNSETRA